MSWAAGAVVGLVLLISGASKLVSPGWPLQAADLGVPTWVARLVPPVELVLGALLVVGVAQPWAPWLAVVLLVAFTTLLVLRLAQGRRPPCACFGRLSQRPIGWWSVARNVVLVALAVVAAVG